MFAREWDEIPSFWIDLRGFLRYRNVFCCIVIASSWWLKPRFVLLQLYRNTFQPSFLFHTLAGWISFQTTLMERFYQHTFLIISARVKDSTKKRSRVILSVSFPFIRFLLLETWSLVPISKETELNCCLVLNFVCIFLNKAQNSNLAPIIKYIQSEYKTNYISSLNNAYQIFKSQPYPNFARS